MSPRLPLLLGLAASAAMTMPSFGILTLTDGNSVAQLDPSSQAGMFNWSVQGQNQLYQQWFWYRVGSTGPESAINTISTPILSQPTANTATALYTANLFTLQVTYLLTGGSVVAPGQTAVSDLAETIKITNVSASSLAYHFFQYTDFDLVGTPAGDTVTLGRNLAGLFNEAVQTRDGIGMTETVIAPGANHGEVNFNANTLSSLNDAAPTTLTDNAGPAGPGDTTWAFQWDLTLAPGDSVIISKDKNLSVVVPEPASLALLLPAALLLRGRRRS